MQCVAISSVSVARLVQSAPFHNPPVVEQHSEREFAVNRTVSDVHQTNLDTG